MRPIDLLSFLLLLSSLSMYGQSSEKILFCYADFYPDQVENYDFLVVEPSYFDAEDVADLKKNNKLVLAYISLGEVDKGTASYPILEPFSIGENKIWDSKIIDIRNKETADHLDGQIEAFIKVGFDGIFMDNVDNYTYWGPTPESASDLLAFLKNLRTKHPSIHLMQNAGLELIPQTSSLINSLAIESIATDYDFKKKKYRLRDRKEFTTQKKELLTIEQEYELPIIVIEYSDSSSLQQEVYKRLRGTEWSVFIGNIELDKISNP